MSGFFERQFVQLGTITPQKSFVGDTRLCWSQPINSPPANDRLGTLLRGLDECLDLADELGLLVAAVHIDQAIHAARGSKHHA